MKITQDMQQSVPFQYAYGVQNGTIVTGLRIKQAVARFFKWIDEADTAGFYLNHAHGMHIIDFFPAFLNHTKGKLAGKPFVLSPFQQFTLYNVFAWKDSRTHLRRINTVYDKRAKKNGKSAEMAGLALYSMAFDDEQEAEIYVGATKEEQAKICWNQAKQFIMSPVASPAIKRLGFLVRQKEILFPRTGSKMMPLGGDSKTQDGINAHLSIIDEYHAHRDDSVKENLESSSVQRAQPITWHITTAGTNIASFCKNYEDAVIEVLEGRKHDNHLWIMIHDIDEGDDWNDEQCWGKANPLLGQGLDIDNIRKEYTKAVNQPSKAPNFKTKHLNIWVDAPTIWIPNEIFVKNRYKENGINAVIPMEKFTKNRSFAGLDMSSTTDLTAFSVLSEPDENGVRYWKCKIFCPEATIERRSKEDRVPYRYWADAGYIIATTGDIVDHDTVYDEIIKDNIPHAIKRIEIDRYLATNITSRLMDNGVEVSWFSQGILNISPPTKEFNKLVYSGKLLYQYNPVIEWALSGCIIYEDANENIKVHKGKSHLYAKRVDPIISGIMALGGSISIPPEESKYSKPMSEDELYI